MTFEEMMKGFEEVRKDFVEIKEAFREANRRIEQEHKERKEKEEKDRQERKEKEEKKAQEAKEYEARMQRSERIAEQANMAVSKLSSKWGDFVEGMVLPATERLFEEKGIEVEHVSQRVKSRSKDMEIDIMAVNGDFVIAIEVKSTLGVNDVKDHIKRLKNFKLVFKEYENRKIIGAVAGIVIEEGVDKFAYNNGLFVIGQSGDSVKFLNDNEFVPRYY